MSKNIRSKQVVKTKPKLDTIKKSLSVSSSTETKKLPTKPTVSSRTTSIKDEEKKKPPATRNPVQVPSVKRISNGSSTRLPAAKTTTSRSNSITASKTPKIATRPVSDKKNHPLPAKPSPSTAKAIPVRPPSSKPNLAMSTVHNVTVSSPPSKRRDVPIEPIIEGKEPKLTSNSRTLNPDEIVILKGKMVEPKPEEEKPPKTHASVKVKEPVAFEVPFDKNQKELSKSKSPSPSDSGPDYDDDFESYESDFETGSSSAEAISQSSRSSQHSQQNNSDSPSLSSETEPECHSEDDDEESELTQFPITVIHRDKEHERKLDSGNYDLNSRKRRTIEAFDSLDTIANYEQLDSGISYENSIVTAGHEPGSVAYVSSSTFQPGSLVFGGYSGFFSRPSITKRGLEIMSKIQFDTIAFTLLELKPIPYETYMRMFGSSNTEQTATQTREDRAESECQTDVEDLRSVWTQHPPQYNPLTAQTSAGSASCTGELADDDNPKPSPHEDIFDNTIRALSKWRQDTSISANTARKKPVDFERLNAFLNNSALLISRILSSNTTNLRLDTHELPELSNGFYKLNTNLLNALKVVRVFANTKFNLILTVHESLANVYHNDFTNLIMVWNTGDASKPVRLLSTWSEVCRAEICNESPDIVLCGLRDGSVAMWDLRETYSFCSKLDGYLTHFAPTHSITPSWGGADIHLFDFGAIVDVKSFRSPLKTGVQTFKTVQFASLNETGILVIWTLVETNLRSFDTTQGPDSKFEYKSPWARVKLTQSAICDLREYIELGTARPKSAFERTKSNFQMEIFQDDILKELAETKRDFKLGLQGLRFINLDCGTELIFVGTNRNFIISCSKTLKRERFQKINIVDSGFLFPTAIKLLQNENYLVVGLSNGSVTLLNCNRETANNQNKPQTSENPRGQTAQSRKHDFDFEIGKSCAIQNIIRNERRSTESQFTDHDFRPSTATLIAAAIEGGKKPFEMRVFDEQVLLNGSVLRKNLIQNLEVSSDGWTLFALSDGDVRAYDFYTDKEVAFNGHTSTNRKVMQIAVNRGGGENKQLILLNEDNNIQVHLLK